MSLGAGSLPEEMFNICYREDCAVLKMLRRRAVEHVARSGALSTLSELVVAVDRALRRIGYVAKDVRTAVVEEYARVLQLDIAPREDVSRALGGREGWTFEDLLYGDSPVADALHEALMALYMQYAEGDDVEKLGTADFAAYATMEFYVRGRLSRDAAEETLKKIADLALET